MPESKDDLAKDHIEFERRSIWELIPPRTFGRVAALSIVLITIFYLQARSGSLAKSIGDSLFPPPPPRLSPAAEAPRVRLAPPPPTPNPGNRP